jgi:hypothetical protein
MRAPAWFDTNPDPDILDECSFGDRILNHGDSPFAIRYSPMIDLSAEG